LKGNKPYWFLYEGTPGGELDLENDFVVRSSGKRTPATEPWEDDIPEPEWVYFGAENTDRILYLVHHEDDEHVDSYRQMENNMTVFGFGRQGIKKHLDRVPEHFTIGFSECGDLASVSETINSAFRPVRVRVQEVKPFKRSIGE